MDPSNICSPSLNGLQSCPSLTEYVRARLHCSALHSSNDITDVDLTPNQNDFAISHLYPAPQIDGDSPSLISTHVGNDLSRSILQQISPAGNNQLTHIAEDRFSFFTVIIKDHLCSLSLSSSII